MRVRAKTQTEGRAVVQRVEERLHRTAASFPERKVGRSPQHSPASAPRFSHVLLWPR